MNMNIDKEYRGLVWRGKIIKRLESKCEYEHYLVEFKCEYIKKKIVVCGQLFTYRDGDDVQIPMEFEGIGNKIYNPLAENTPVTRFLTLKETLFGIKEWSKEVK